MTKTQPPISTDGVSIDLDATSKAAARRVDRTEEGVPIHVCGKVMQRCCPCWQCVSKDCAACGAD